MNEKSNPFMFQVANAPGEALELVGHLFEVAKPDTVYSEPLNVEDRTIITASELVVSMGAAYGGGGGSSPATGEEEQEETDFGGGGGGGGGGYSMGRPVAVITIGPDGTHVEPIVDPTKIAIAFFTTMAAMILTLGQILRRKRP
jgi:uncharacterized spore protein YtfJ